LRLSLTGVPGKAGSVLQRRPSETPSSLRSRRERTVAWYTVLRCSRKTTLHGQLVTQRKRLPLGLPPPTTGRAIPSRPSARGWLMFRSGSARACSCQEMKRPAGAAGISPGSRVASVAATGTQGSASQAKSRHAPEDPASDQPGGTTRLIAAAGAGLAGGTTACRPPARARHRACLSGAGLRAGFPLTNRGMKASSGKLSLSDSSHLTPWFASGKLEPGQLNFNTHYKDCSWHVR
jgi:hypothetical protein